MRCLLTMSLTIGQSSRYYWLFIVNGNLEYLQIGRFQATITRTTYCPVANKQYIIIKASQMIGKTYSGRYYIQIASHVDPG
jgi:hypothetical protein